MKAKLVSRRSATLAALATSEFSPAESYAGDVPGNGSAAVEPIFPTPAPVANTPAPLHRLIDLRHRRPQPGITALVENNSQEVVLEIPQEDLARAVEQVLAAGLVNTAAYSPQAALPPVEPDATGLLHVLYEQLRAQKTTGILDWIESELIQLALRETDTNYLRTSRILGINRATLKKRVKTSPAKAA